MLSIQPLKSAKSACDYYTKAFEYYQDDSTATAWFGKSRNDLKLGETIQKEVMLNLLSGVLPTGERLQNKQGLHRPGFDMTFSAPKSVSILVGLDIAPELLKFHDNAVHFALSQIEREFAEVRIIREGETHFQKTGNLLFATFRQPSSRANDPALHTHCVTMNLSFHEGKARSLSSDKHREHGVIEQIQNHAHYCGLLYRHALANSLKKAGFHLRLTGDGLFEIEGVPDPVLEAFSTRREDIEALMHEEGWVGAAAASRATLLTRPSKEESNLTVLKQSWKERSEAMNFDAQTFAKNLNEPRAWLDALKERFVSKSHLNSAERCVEVAIEVLSQRTSVFTERALKMESMKHSLILPEIISEQSILDEINKAKASQALYVSDINDALLTTPWLLTLETESLERIRAHQGAVSAISTIHEVDAFQHKIEQEMPHPLTASQKEAMMVLLTTQDRYVAVQGYAGVAKTSMLAHARGLIEAKGYHLRGVTVASSAAHELQMKAHIKTDVFPIVYQELKHARRGSLAKTIIIVDEASMISSPQGHALIKLVERANARLVFVGDSAQLPTVNNGRLFGLVQEHGIETVVMSDIVRQKNESAKEAVFHATKREVREAIDKLAHVEECPSYHARIEWMAKHWLSQPPAIRQQTLIFAPTHANRVDLTRIIRQSLKDEGTLKPESLMLSTLKSKNLEAIQQRFAAHYQSGDIVRINQATKSIKVGYYQLKHLSKKHLKNNVLPLIDEQGKTRLYPLKDLPKYKTHTAAFERLIEVYRPTSMELCVGDEVIWNRNFKQHEIRNGQRATLKEMSEKVLTFSLEDGKTIRIDKCDPLLRHIDYAYVLTNYKVQGKDAHYGLGLMESNHRYSANLKNFYVQISRAVHGMTLVTDSREHLIQAIEHNKDEKQAALDVLSAQQVKQHEMHFKQTKELERE